MFIMGLFAGILGVAASLLSISVKSTTPSYYLLESASIFYESSWLALLFSIIGLIGTAKVNGNWKIAGTLMIIAGIGGFIFLSKSYIFSTILFFIAGMVGIFSKKHIRQ